MNINRVCILGGTGFVGHHLTARLTAAGLQCRIPSRHPQRHRDLQVLPGVELVPGNLGDPANLRQLFEGCQAVINLVGILNEPRGSQGAGFRRVYVELVEQVAEAGRAAGVGRLLHMSALHANASQGPSLYLRYRGEGENLAHIRAQGAMQVTSFRPSVIFGPGDSFFNRFAGLLGLAPGGLLPLACPEARFQPVFVGDVVEAFARALNDPATWDQRYDLCGPRIFSLRGILEYTARLLGKRVRVVGLNDRLSRLQARVMDYMPGRPFTYDNYLSMRVDSVCQGNGLGRLGIEPRDVDEIVPLYLGGGTPPNRYSRLRQTA